MKKEFLHSAIFDNKSVFEIAQKGVSILACKDVFENPHDHRFHSMVRVGECTNIIDINENAGLFIEYICNGIGKSKERVKFDYFAWNRDAIRSILILQNETSQCAPGYYNIFEKNDQVKVTELERKVDVFNIGEIEGEIQKDQPNLIFFDGLLFTKEEDIKKACRTLEDIAGKFQVAIVAFWACVQGEISNGRVVSTYFSKCGHNVCHLFEFTVYLDYVKRGWGHRCVCFEFGGLNPKRQYFILNDDLQLEIEQDVIYITELLRLLSKAFVTPGGRPNKPLVYIPTNQLKHEMLGYYWFNRAFGTVENHIAKALKYGILEKQGYGTDTKYKFIPASKNIIDE